MPTLVTACRRSTAAPRRHGHHGHHRHQCRRHRHRRRHLHHHISYAAATIPSPEASAGQPLATLSHAAVFAVIGLDDSLPRCRRRHLWWCWPPHPINLRTSTRSRTANASSMSGHMPETVRPELGPRACGSRRAPLAAGRRLAATSKVRCWMCASPCVALPMLMPTCASRFRLCCCCVAGCGCGFEFRCWKPGWRLKSRKIESGLLPEFHGALLGP